MIWQPKLRVHTDAQRRNRWRRVKALWDSAPLNMVKTYCVINARL